MTTSWETSKMIALGKGRAGLVNCQRLRVLLLVRNLV